MDIENCTPEEWIANESTYKSQILEQTVWNSIPLLNVNDLHNLKDNRLVRFNGMVQDMHGSEFYLEKYEVVNEESQESYIKQGKYYDIFRCQGNESIDIDGPLSVKSERQSYVAISIPALNDWVKTLIEQKHKIAIPAAPSSSNTQVKRTISEEEDMETEIAEQVVPSTSSKRLCTTQSPPINVPERSSFLSKEHLLNFPIPDAFAKACHLKTYDESFNLNTVGEFVGFLSVSPMLANDNEDVEDDEEFQTHNPPPSLIPRLHCVAYKPIKHCNPLLEIVGRLNTDRMVFIRNELMILFTQLLFGDELAAEYLIYNLISEVYLRKDFMAIGKMSLNLSNIPNLGDIDYGGELYKFIELLVEKSHYVGMSLTNMNDLTFAPKKDYKCNRLTSSILQLSNNTHLVLDETKLSAGKLNAEGVNNVKAIAQTIKNQKTLYDFTFYQIDFDTDIPFLVLSEGKSMLPSDFHVVLKPDELHLLTFSEILEAARHFLTDELLNEIRVYLTCARLTEYQLNDKMQEMVSNEFVKMRQENRITADDLHSLLVLARLVSISQGKTELDEESWKRACVLEQSRKERIK